MIAAIIITVLLIPSTLLLMANVAVTEGFRGRVPSGPDSMGLAMPVIGTGLGTIGFLIATWINVGHGGFNWITINGGLALVVATIATVGICLAAFFALVAWMEKWTKWIFPLGNIGSGIGPLSYAIILLICAWAPPGTLAAGSFPLIATAIVAPISLAGLSAGAYAGSKALRRSIERSSRAMEEEMEREREYQRRQSLSPLEKLKEDYATMNDQSPLWSYTAALPDYKDADCRAYIVERSLKLPNLDEQLAGTICADHPRYRHGCFDLIRFAPADSVKPQWAPAIERAIRLTAKQIRENPDWLKADEFSNPDPVEHIRSMKEAAGRVGGGETIDSAIYELRSAVEAQPASERRTSAIAALSVWMTETFDTEA